MAGRNGAKPSSATRVTDPVPVLFTEVELRDQVIFPLLLDRLVRASPNAFRHQYR